MSLILKNKFVYVFLILLLFSSFIDNNFYLVINLIISIFYILLYFKESKYDWKFWVTIGLLGSIVIIGATRFNNSWYDYGKDLFYFIKPIIFFILGYVLIQNILLKNIIKVSVYFVLIFAVVHDFLAVCYLLKHPLEIEGIRNSLGRGYILEVFAIYFLILKKESFFSFKSKYAIIYLLIIFASCLFYFSRTNLVILFVLLIFSIPKISFKKLYYMSISLLFVSVVLLYNYNVFSKPVVENKIVLKQEEKIEKQEEKIEKQEEKIEKQEEKEKAGVEVFTKKIENSNKEIFSQNFDDKSLKELYEHWRAYEAKCALEQTKNIIIGNGFGSLVDIHFPVLLGKEKMNFIPILHNGYVYIIFKTGIIGLIFYILFVVIQFWKRKNIERDIYYFQVGIAVSIILITFVITGIYGKTDLTILFLGIILGLSIRNKKCIKA